MYDRGKLQSDTRDAGRMFLRETPRMLGYVVVFYGLLGIGIPWRLHAAREVIWNSTKASLVFGLSAAGICLAAGAILMSGYLLRRAPYTDFGPAASLTMARSIRLFGLAGVPIALWGIFSVAVPAAGPRAHELVHNWWMWLVTVGVVAGWFSGGSVGGLVGLLSIWISGRVLIGRL
jgi:hypothetical protein